MTISESKKVSVIVPNYNYGKYIKKRIVSILKQTYPIYELIVLDDASTDGSVKIIEKIVSDLEIKKPNLKIRFVPSVKNSGKVMQQWKKGFELAEGDFVWIAEADDLCSRKFLEEAMKAFSDPEVVLSYTESMIINESGLIIAPNFRWSRDKEGTGHYKKSYVKDGVREIEEIMAVRCTIPNVSAVVFRKTGRIPYMEYFKEAMKFTQVGDWYFYTRVLDHGKISYNKRALNKFRIHKDSKTGESKSGGEHYQEILEMHRMFALKYNIVEAVARRMKAEEVRVKMKHGLVSE